MSIITKQVPVKWDMTVYVGDEWPAWNFNVVDESNAPIIGFTVLMQIRKSPFGVVEKTLSGGSGFIIASENVKFNTEVDLIAGKHLYDIQITLSNGEIHSQYEGEINAVQDISRVVTP